MEKKKSVNKVVGSKGESLAADFLVRKGYEILERNFRYGRGEIDLIARRGNLITFCEVKTRRSRVYGVGEDAVDSKKQNQIRTVAEGYTMTRDLASSDFRFDVIVVEMMGKTTTIRFIENAF